MIDKQYVIICLTLVMFRVFPETFHMVLRLLRPILNATNARGRKQISPEKQLMITLWFMATPDSYRYVILKPLEEIL